MIKYRKLLKKDRYGVIRGSLVIGAMLLLCLFLFVSAINYIIISSEKEEAECAASSTAARLEQLLEGNRTSLSSLALLIGDDAVQTNAVLDTLVQNGSFSDAAYISGGQILYASGDYTEGEISPEILNRDISIQEDRIVFTVPVSDDSCIVARLESGYVEAVLEDAFEEPYGYVVFDVSTGDYLINNSDLGSASYYDALLAINEDGQAEALLSSASAQARIKRDGFEYIAQQETSIADWSVSLLIPEAIINKTLPGMEFLPLYAAIVAIIFIAILAWITVFAQRRMQISNQNAVRALDSSDRMMSIAAKDSHLLLFVYNLGQDRLLAFYDGMGLISRQPDGASPLRSLLDITRLCGINEAELVRIKGELKEIRRGEEIDFMLHGSMGNQDECILRVSFYASTEDSKNLICSIGDCTQELESRDRAEIERSYQDTMRFKANSIWQINISRNRWSMQFSVKENSISKIFKGTDDWRDYNADLGGELKKQIHSADYDDFAENMSIVGIASMYRSGKHEFSQDYRVSCGKKGNYAWRRMDVRIWMNPETNDIIANLYVFDVDAEKHAQEERGERKRILHKALTAMGGIYSGLYYVDLIEDKSYTARSIGGELEDGLCVPYKATFDSYIRDYVHPDNRQALTDLLNAYKLRREIKEGSHLRRVDFLRKIDDSRYGKASIIVQPARFENAELREVVLAIRYDNELNNN